MTLKPGPSPRAARETSRKAALPPAAESGRTRTARLQDTEIAVAFPVGARKRTVQVPSLGRVVHYRATASPHWTEGTAMAALISATPSVVSPQSAVDLCVFAPSGPLMARAVPYGAGPGEWSWPPFVASVEVEDDG